MTGVEPATRRGSVAVPDMSITWHGDGDDPAPGSNEHQ